jgi:hypothetical protein
MEPIRTVKAHTSWEASAQESPEKRHTAQRVAFLASGLIQISTLLHHLYVPGMNQVLARNAILLQYSGAMGLDLSAMYEMRPRGVPA